LPKAIRNLTADPIPALIRQLALPASVGMFFNTMYNVVDTYYAGRMSTDALAALSLTFPIYFTLLAMGMGFSTGATALMGNALGRQDRAEAALTASQGLILSILLAIVVMTTGYLTAPALFRLLGAQEEYLDLCLQYIHVILGGSGMTMFVFMFNGILNAQGDTHSYRDYLIVATVANIILDPWFMYGGWGVPAMGVRGIAAATILVQVFGACFLGWKVRRTGMIFRSSGARWRPDRRVLGAIVGQGVPASLNMMTVALGIFIITYFLSSFGQKTVAAYGAATRIEQIVLLPALGLNVAALTLAAQNSGAGLFDRVRSTVRYALLYGAGVMVVGAALVFFGAGPLMRLFSEDPEVVAIGVKYLRIAAFVEHAYVFLFINTSLLQGLKKPAFALWIGLYRQLIMPPILFYMVTRVWHLGLTGIWWGIFGISWSAAIVAVLFARSQVDRMARTARTSDSPEDGEDKEPSVA
jgi:putative MATE family efflux protein